MTPASRPVVMILDPSTAYTGARRCGEQTAAALSPACRVILIEPEAYSGFRGDTAAFDGVEHLPLRQIRRSIRDLVVYGPSLLRSSVKLLAMLKRNRATTLIVNDVYLLHGVVCRLLGWQGQLVVWVRSDPAQMPGMLRRLWIGTNRRAADRIVAVSDHVAAQLGDDPVVCRIYDHLPDEIVLPAAREGGQRIVSIANFTRGKGQDLVLAAFAVIADEFPAATLTLRGGDMGLEKNRKFRGEIEHSARAAGLSERVTIAGFGSTAEILKECDVFVNFSASETFSMTCLEAMGAGIPVVATRSGGPAEIVVDGITGVLVANGDVAAGAAALRTVLGDRELQLRMGTAGARRARSKFGPDGFAAALKAALNLPSA